MQAMKQDKLQYAVNGMSGMSGGQNTKVDSFFKPTDALENGEPNDSFLALATYWYKYTLREKPGVNATDQDYALEEALVKEEFDPAM